MQSNQGMRLNCPGCSVQRRRSRGAMGVLYPNLVSVGTIKVSTANDEMFATVMSCFDFFIDYQTT